MKKRKIKAIRKRAVLFVIILSMVMSFVPANAFTLTETTLTLDSGKRITLTKAQLDEIITITSEEAEAIAVLFVNDMITIGGVNWNEQTEVTSVVPMYDNSNTDEITAYTVNFNTGYVVVSAYLDAESLIPEWSDKATPLYEEISADETDKIIYLGAYEYYSDNGTDTVIGLNDIKMRKSELINHIEEARDIKYIPESAFTNLSTNITTHGSGIILDPIAYANSNYAGPFRVYETFSPWENYIDYYTNKYALEENYREPCGPVAITNLIAAFRNRYPTHSSDVIENNDDLFREIAEFGKVNGYYSNIGAYISKLDDYLVAIINKTSIIASVTTDTLDTYDELKNHITSNRLLLIVIDYLNSAEDSVSHTITCYGVTRLVSNTTGYYSSYAEIADGWNVSPRYIRVGTIFSDLIITFEPF